MLLSTPDIFNVSFTAPTRRASVILEQDRNRQNQLSEMLNDSRENIGSKNGITRRRASHSIARLNNDKDETEILSKNNESLQNSLSKLPPINDEEITESNLILKNHLEEFVDKALEINNKVFFLAFQYFIK